MGRDEPGTRSRRRVTTWACCCCKPKEAELFYRRTLEGCEQNLGPDRPTPNKLSSVINLGNLLKARNSYGEGEVRSEEKGGTGEIGRNGAG